VVEDRIVGVYDRIVGVPLSFQQKKGENRFSPLGVIYLFNVLMYADLICLHITIAVLYS
jgi:hypothetical protein